MKVLFIKSCKECPYCVKTQSSYYFCKWGQEFNADAFPTSPLLTGINSIPKFCPLVDESDLINET